MKRRLMLKQVAVATAAAWLMPSCITDAKKLSVALDHLDITADEEELMGDIADVIIPRTETPGARDVEAHLFVLVMADDCLSAEDRDKFLKGMRSFETEVQALTGKSFSKSTAEERLYILTSLESDTEKASDELKTFYGRTRSYIIQGYTSSRHFLTDVKPYQLVPGPDFRGCVPVSEAQPLA